MIWFVIAFTFLAGFITSVKRKTIVAISVLFLVHYFYMILAAQYAFPKMPGFYRLDTISPTLWIFENVDGALSLTLLITIVAMMGHMLGDLHLFLKKLKTIQNL